MAITKFAGSRLSAVLHTKGNYWNQKVVSLVTVAPLLTRDVVTGMFEQMLNEASQELAAENPEAAQRIGQIRRETVGDDVVYLMPQTVATVEVSDDTDVLEYVINHVVVKEWREAVDGLGVIDADLEGFETLLNMILDAQSVRETEKVNVHVAFRADGTIVMVNDVSELIEEAAE